MLCMIDPINLVQVALLRRVRDTGEGERLRDALLMTISGIAAVYNRHTYMEEMREAVSLYDSHLVRLVSD